MGEAAREISPEDRGISDEKKPAEIIDFEQKVEAKEDADDNYEQVKFLSERVNSFNEAMKMLPEHDSEIVAETLKGIESTRDEMSMDLSDEQMHELGLDALRINQLNEKVKALKDSIKVLEGADKDDMLEKRSALVERVKKIVDGLDEKEREEFSKRESEEGIVALGLEGYRVKHIDEALDILKNASDRAEDEGKKAIIDEKIKVLKEKRNIFAENLQPEEMEELEIEVVEEDSDEEIRKKYGIKTIDELIEELESAA